MTYWEKAGWEIADISVTRLKKRKRTAQLIMKQD